MAVCNRHAATTTTGTNTPGRQFLQADSAAAACKLLGAGCAGCTKISSVRMRLAGRRRNWPPRHGSNPAPSTSSPLTRGKDNPAGYRQQPPACAVEPTLVGNFVSMATNDRQLRCLDTGPSR
ncbi:hypothetical protein MGG_16736 [Pyricularia oryzae 70-15]|uniref:Uncharacterized protein n=1 Tax=Pyricularia oryzae (strain 70-15 / ATCC MYA-4617 / FGSC 8958) TaxID=242507 RepID=G4N4N7_PYRO7|nr:uncharacterized protein MGG_16736 [Pyricularia oryzae 70-15]EHA52052.1 hypothetical protein MGG_16736 [Pyricularia oryzae 70-15]